MDKVRRHWEVPAVAHFCSLFRTIFKLIDFDIEDFEEALLLDASENDRSSLVVDLLIALLKGCTGRRDVSLLNYNQFLHDVLASKWEQAGIGPNPLGPRRDRASFHTLPVYVKIKLFHCLCEWRLQRPDVEPLTKNLDGDSLRVNPLGKDEDGATFWYFYGTRLYKEDPEPVKLKILPPRRPPPKKKKGSQRKKKVAKRQKKPPAKAESSGKGTSVTRRSTRQAAKRKAGSDEEEEEEDEEPEESALEEENGSEFDESSRATSRAEAVKLSLVSRLKPELVERSNRSSPACSETGDGVISNRTLQDLIDRMYSRDDDEESTYPPSSACDEDSRISFDCKPTTNSGIKISPPNGNSPKTGEDGMETNRKDPNSTGEAETKQELKHLDSKLKTEETENDKTEVDEKLSNGIKSEGTEDEEAQREQGEASEEAAGTVEPEMEVGPPAYEQEALEIDTEAASRWHLVCDTLEGWKELSEKFKQSKSKAEKDLHKLLDEDFVPEMETMFEQKEKEQRRKMAELSKRSSDRLEMRRITRQQEAAELNKRTEAEKDRIAGLEQERQRKIEQEQREHRARVRELEKEKAYRMKQRAREERSRRLELRQERQRCMANGEEIPEHLKGANSNGPYLEDEALDELDIELEFERMYGQLEKVLDAVKNSPDAEAFRHEVKDADAPGYSEKIKNQMCIDEMEAKLLEREYKSKNEFIDDMNLIFLNCLKYNGWMSDYTKLAQKTERCFIKAYKKYFPPSEVIENERARREEWECVTKLGALDRKIREQIETPKPPPPTPPQVLDRSAAKKPRLIDSVTPRGPHSPSITRNTVMNSLAAQKSLAPKPANRNYQNPPVGYKIADPGTQRTAVRTPSVLPGTTRPTGPSLYAIKESPGPSRTTPIYAGAPQGSVSAISQDSKNQGEEQRPNVYVLPTKDGNRLLKFVTRDGNPASHELVTHLLPQLRKEAYKLPKGLLTLTVDSEDASPPNPQPPPPRQIVRQAPPVRTFAATPQAPGASTVRMVSPPTPSKRFYDMGDSTYLAIEEGNPFLYKKQADGALVKLHQVSREGLVEKLKMIQDRRKQNQSLNNQTRAQQVTVNAGPSSATRPVCSVAPQRQITPQMTPPRIQQSLSVPAGVSFQEIQGGSAAGLGQSTILVPASSRTTVLQSHSVSGAPCQSQQLVLVGSPTNSNQQMIREDGHQTQVILQGAPPTPILFSSGGVTVNSSSGSSVYSTNSTTQQSSNSGQVQFIHVVQAPQIVVAQSSNSNAGQGQTGRPQAGILVSPRSTGPSGPRRIAISSQPTATTLNATQCSSAGPEATIHSKGTCQE